MDKEFDVVLYGATGFTGKQTAHYFAAHAPKSVKWAIAGRNKEKLAALAKETGDPPVVVADSSDEASVRAMAARTRVLLTTAGPFAKYGTPVVAACVEAKTDYVDITGETPWARKLIDDFHETAQKNGTRIIPFCGFDSVPSDIGTLFVVDELRKRGSTDVKLIQSAFKVKGGLNGGTLDSAITMSEAGASMADPLLLNPRDRMDENERKRSKDLRAVVFHDALNAWLAPFVMAQINTRVVRRSHAFLGYGTEFTYREAMEFSKKRSATVAGGFLAVADSMLRRGWTRKLLKTFGPKPGQGPSEETMDNGFFRIRLVGEGQDGQKVLCSLQSQGDPGNRVTVKILCESALMLAADRDKLPDAAGVVTPAVGLGLGLLDRLRAQGFETAVSELSKAETAQAAS